MCVFRQYPNDNHQLGFLQGDFVLKTPASKTSLLGVCMNLPPWRGPVAEVAFGGIYRIENAELGAPVVFSCFLIASAAICRPT